jgi:hypothetical protein
VKLILIMRWYLFFVVVEKGVYKAFVTYIWFADPNKVGFDYVRGIVVRIYRLKRTTFFGADTFPLFFSKYL